MGRYVPNTYRNFRAVRILITVLISLVLAAVILFVALFFGLRKYAVYSAEGVRLEIPFLMEDSQDISD